MHGTHIKINRRYLLNMRGITIKNVSEKVGLACILSTWLWIDFDQLSNYGFYNKSVCPLQGKYKI